MQNFRVTYLMPRPENLMAQPDKDVPGFYRHATLLASPDARSIISEIRQRGGLPLEVKPVKPKPAWLSNVNRAYKLQLLQAINYNVRGGMSSARALEMVVEGETGATRGVLNPALTVLRTGGTFPEAMRALGFFDDSTLSIIEAGERTGRMKDSLNAAASHYEKTSNGLKAMFGAVSWTVLDIGFAVTSIIGLRFSLLPTLTNSTSSSGETDAEKEAFKALVDQAYLVNDVLIGGTIVLLALVFVGIYGYVANVKSIRDRADAFMARVPALGTALVNTAISTSFTVASSMLRGGVPFLPSATTAAAGTQHAEVREFWSNAVQRVETGETIPRALNSPLLNSSEAMLIASHNTQRELGEVLDRIAERRDGIALAASKKFSLGMFVASMVYSGIAVMFTLYVVYVQNKQMMSKASRN
jgi:type II secretory pathway component PulF